MLHYKSHAGGIVPAGADLLATVKASSGFKKNIEALQSEIIKDIEEKFGCACAGSYVRKGGPIGFYTDSNALGNINAKVEEYTVKWRLSHSPGPWKEVEVSFTRYISFRDEYLFNDERNFDSWKQWVTDFLPHLFAGNGTPYVIWGAFAHEGDFMFFSRCND